MALHLIKLCVGVETVDELIAWQRQRLEDMARRGIEEILRHTTRQKPRRREEVLAGGSLYWVIKGEIACRQTIIDLRPRLDEEGIERCDICLSAETIRVNPRLRGPFQGWRYLQAADAPADLGQHSGGFFDCPEDMRRQLRELGVL